MKFPLDGGWFKPGRQRAGSPRIIGVLVMLAAALLLQACSAIKVAYNQAPDPVYRAYMEKLEQEACTTFAALHNSTTPAQRRKAVETLGRYEQDLRALSSPPA